MSAESKNGDLQVALDHLISFADVLKQQREQAEAERDAMKARAEAAESERDAVYVQIECCADEIDILKHEREKWEKRARKLLRNRKSLRAERDVLLDDREFWRRVSALAVGRAGGAKAECEALRKDADIVRRARGRSSLVIEVTPELLTKDAFTDQPLHVMLTDNGDGTHLLTFRESEELHTLRKELDAWCNTGDIATLREQGAQP